MSSGGAGARRSCDGPGLQLLGGPDCRDLRPGSAGVPPQEGLCPGSVSCPAGGISLSALAMARLMPMFLWLNANGTIRGAGPTLAKILGGGPDRLAGGDFFALFEIRRPRGLTGMERLRAHAGARLQLRLRDGPRTAFRGVAVPVACGAGMIVNLSFGISVADAVRDHALTDADFAPTDLAVELLYLAEAKAVVMEELHDLNRRLQQAKSTAEAEAQTDILTGLANRRAFDQMLGTLLRGQRPFGLMHLDLDYFKEVNDGLGHAAGDHVLRKVAQRLRGETRAGDIVSRVGGDEFVLLFPGLEDAAILAQIAGRIITRLSAPINYAGTPCHISASVGFVLSGDFEAPTPAGLLASADAALYASKAGGRGRWTRWGPALGRKG